MRRNLLLRLAALTISFSVILTLFMQQQYIDKLAPGNNASDIAEAESNTDAVKTDSADEKEDYSVFSEFTPITEKQLIEIANTDELKGIAKSGDSIFMITSDGRKLVTDDFSIDTLQFLKLAGLEISEIQVEGSLNEDDPAKGSSISANLFSGVMLFGILLAIGTFMYHRHKMTSSIVTYSTTPSNSNKTENDKESTVKIGDGIEIPRVKFEDVEGVDELKEDIFRIVDCLKHPEKYEQAGARIPKGIILYGPPGTGKTLLAKAIAGEAEVPFLAAVGSDFVEKYVGVGAKRVRELYKKAKSKAPCIVFIDEVDAVAGKRGEENNGENDQTINALLSELDGFGSTSKIITICATNRLDMLDSAFTRAGRFDLKLAVGLPDKKSRLKILKIHSKNKKLADDISLEALANKTAGFSGAELEALLNEAAMLSAGQDNAFITNSNIDDAFFKIIMQGNKKKREKIDQMNRIVAWHESGHTLAARLIADDIVNSVTIIGSSSGAGGVTFRTPREEGLQSKKYLRDSIAVMYAGRAAEEIYLGSDDLITTGASQDIKQATSIIKQYLAMYGMGEVGMLDLTQLNRDFNSVLTEASKLSKEIYSKTLKILESNKKILEDLASNLLTKETLDEQEIEEIINKHTLKEYQEVEI